MEKSPANDLFVKAERSGILTRENCCSNEECRKQLAELQRCYRQFADERVIINDNIKYHCVKLMKIVGWDMTHSQDD